MEVLRQATARPDAALVLVARTTGSTPRHPGAYMLVGADGKTVGTIGGGRVELEVTELAMRVASGAAPAQRVTHHLVRDLAMCCGGTMELFVTRTGPVASALTGALARLGRREPSLLIFDTIAGAAELAPRPPASRRAELEGDRLLLPLWPPERLVIFGLGHVARAIGPLAAGVGFEIVVCDDNETGQLDAPPPWADRVVSSFEPADVERELGPLGARDFVLVLTRDHAVDERIVAALLPRVDELAYLGLIGSAGKVGRFRRRLEARGVATPERWARLRSPIGVDIAAETPAEIAVSVVAELIDRRHRGEAG